VLVVGAMVQIPAERSHLRNPHGVASVLGPTPTLAVDASPDRSSMRFHMASVKKAGGGEAAPPLQEVVAELAPRRQTLSALDNKLSELLRTIEEKFRDHVSTRVSTCINSVMQEEIGSSWVEMLTFGKWDNKWQLLLESGDDDDPENWKVQLLSSAPREKRVQVLTEGHMEKLIREASKQLDAQIADREKAVQIADALVVVLNPQGADDDLPF
jgi:hypothetical protein